MSAELPGEKLLMEVQEENLNELLSEIRSIASPLPASNLGVEGLDRLLDVFRHPTPRLAAQTPGWTSPEYSSDNDYVYNDPNTPVQPARGHLPPIAKSRSAIIELTSSRSASGKSQLLYYLAASAVLPCTSGGRECTVVWLDTDGRFSVSRLFQIMDHLLVSQHPSITKNERNFVIKDGLSHIHTFRPQSSAQLLSTLESLPFYLLSPGLHASISRPLALLILDSATSFYWPDRSDAELERLNDLTASTEAYQSKSAMVISQIRSMQNTFDCTVLLTTNQSFYQTKSQTNRPREPTLVSPWTSFATVTLSISRDVVPQFVPTMTVKECARDQSKRLEAVRRGRFQATVLWRESENSAIRESVRKSKRGEGFSFRATERGIDFH